MVNRSIPAPTLSLGEKPPNAGYRGKASVSPVSGKGKSVIIELMPAEIE
jgi:hypothetical protein